MARQLHILRQLRTKGDAQGYRFLLKEEDARNLGGSACTYYRSPRPFTDQRSDHGILRSVFDDLDNRIRERFPSACLQGSWLHMSDADWVVLEMIAESPDG